MALSLATVGLYLLILPVSLFAYFVYRFFIRIYIEAWRLKKMDPQLKVFVKPITGLVQVQRDCIDKHGDSHYFVKEMMRQNPDQRAYLTNIGDRPFLICTDAQLVRDISVNPQNFEKFQVFKHLAHSYKKGIFLAEGAQWKLQKSLIGPAFNYEHLKRMIPIMNKCSKTYMEHRLENLSQEPILEVLEATETLIGEILVRTFFSNEIAQRQIHGKNLSLVLADFSSMLFARSRSGSNLIANMVVGPKACEINFEKKDAEMEQILNEIRKVLFEIIDGRIQNNDETKQDFIQIYLNEMKKRQQEYDEAKKNGQDTSKIELITKEELLQQLMSFYFAGIDTTGHLLSFALYCAAEYPECYNKLEKELNEVIKSEQDITYESLNKLDYTEKYLNECLRMWPPAVGILTRVATKEIKLGPYTIPKGMNVGTNILGLMHNPKYYKNPGTFDPDRWYDKESLPSESYAFIPFSAGPRSCIGKHLALMEAKIILIYFMKYFNLKRTEVPLKLHCKFLYEPVDGRLVRLEKKAENHW